MDSTNRELAEGLDWGGEESMNLKSPVIEF